MKHIAFAIACAALTLAACSQPAETDSATATSPPAPQWVPVAQSGDGSAIQYDPAQVKIYASGGLADVVVRIRHPYLEGWTRDLPPGYAGETTFQTEQATLRFNCATREMGIVVREALGAEGQVLDKRVTPEPVTLSPIVASGVADAVFPKVCTPAGD